MKKILIVDDSRTTRQVLNFSLNDAGYDVTEAIDGQEALSILERDAFDLIITDLKMPRLDGLDLTRRIRSNKVTRKLPVIILTTESAEEKKQEGKEAGANCWIVKPFHPEQLLEVVKFSLEKS